MNITTNYIPKNWTPGDVPALVKWLNRVDDHHKAKFSTVKTKSNV